MCRCKIFIQLIYRLKVRILSKSSRTLLLHAHSVLSSGETLSLRPLTLDALLELALCFACSRASDPAADGLDALGTALIHQFTGQNPASKALPLAGLTRLSDGAPAIDTNALLLALIERCKSDPIAGTTIDDAVRCAAGYYREAGAWRSTKRYSGSRLSSLTCRKDCRP